MFVRRLLLPFVVLCGQAGGQLLHPVAPMPSYSVASVRPSNLHDEDPHGSTTADTYRAERTTMREVLAYAFGLGYADELLNAPAWVRDERFDVQGKLDDDQVAALAKLSRNDREAQMRLMTQSLLAERFHLAYHFETRPLAVYQLEIAKSGFRCPVDSASPPAIADVSRPRFRWYNAPAPPPPARDAAPAASQPALTLRTNGWPFWLLVSWISHQPELGGHPVIDRTGLEGMYDCRMEWSHDGSVETGEYFFAALANQLGLKLQPTKGPVEVLVVDRIEHPSAN